MTQATQKGRLLSLDVMRGLTIAGMIMVNNPGSWEYVYAPLRHARWDGLTPTDLVFPFFMFIMGVSMFFSLRKYDFTLSRKSVFKVLKRTALIFLVGLGLNLFGHLSRYGFGEFERLRILGVLQRLALAYGAGSLIVLAVNHKYILQLAAGILVFYAALLAFTDSLTLSVNNLIAVTDRALLGESHLYRDTLADGTRIAFDPEGLLSTLGSIGHVLLGFYAGRLILNAKKDNERIIRNLFILGTILLFAGLLLNYGCPINKKIWSSTFVLATCGLGSLLLALLIWIIDINGRKRWSLFFESFGINPLYLYVQAALLSTLLNVSGIHTFVHQSVFVPVFGSFGGSLAWAVFFVLLNWIPGYFWLYKKQIYIKL
ncbi:MAG: heparan-alpha-glucosaminide N-acetyltransferase domain-containing protein [Tannerellaceae bacterium]|jgi:predicted acyltransferase|nr:heparan-alpha-glucosaminide N-acetyltransferase domain-containing protein [Tannerellaceae bacterium]